MPFKPGQSGNPSGRPKEHAHIKALAQEHTEAAIAALVAGLSDDNSRTRIAAAEALLDRGYGKPHQTAELDIRGNLTQTLLGLPKIEPSAPKLPLIAEPAAGNKPVA